MIFWIRKGHRDGSPNPLSSSIPYYNTLNASVFCVFLLDKPDGERIVQRHLFCSKKKMLFPST